MKMDLNGVIIAQMAAALEAGDRTATTVPRGGAPYEFLASAAHYAQRARALFIAVSELPELQEPKKKP
jgi:hypothetical protein